MSSPDRAADDAVPQRGSTGRGARRGLRGPRSARPRRPRTVTSSLAAIVLAVEFLIVVLASLVLLGLRDLPAGVALGGGGAVLVLIGIAAALSSSRIGIALGWLVQVILVLSGRVNLAVGIVALIFVALWIYSMIVGGRIDRRAA